MEIVLATNNFDKVKEIKRILRGLKIKILTLKDFSRMPEVKEDGRILRENAVKKAVQTALRVGKIALADDSGLEVKVLGGRPGVYSSRFAGQGCTYDDNNRKLLRLMQDVPLSKRDARFVCVIAVAVPHGKVRTVTGICKGKITTEIRGRKGFGYDPVFIPAGFKKTFSEMGLSVKNKISHRAKALSKVRRIIEKL
jgi:XTP/dITP diphosphohydrolase